MQRRCEAVTCDLVQLGTIDLKKTGATPRPINFCIWRDEGGKKPKHAQEIRAQQAGIRLTVDVCGACTSGIPSDQQETKQRDCYTQRLRELRQTIQAFTENNH